MHIQMKLATCSNSKTITRYDTVSATKLLTMTSDFECLVLSRNPRARLPERKIARATDRADFGLVAGG